MHDLELFFSRSISFRHAVYFFPTQGPIAEQLLYFNCEQLHQTENKQLHNSFFTISVIRQVHEHLFM